MTTNFLELFKVSKITNNFFELFKVSKQTSRSSYLEAGMYALFKTNQRVDNISISKKIAIIQNQN